MCTDAYSDHGMFKIFKTLIFEVFKIFQEATAE